MGRNLLSLFFLLACVKPFFFLSFLLLGVDFHRNLLIAFFSLFFFFSIIVFAFLIRAREVFRILFAPRLAIGGHWGVL